MGYQTITVTYPQVRFTAVKNLPCPTCSKKVRRQRTFINTMSPFNQHPDGTPRTRSEIFAKLRDEDAPRWQAVAEQCSPCRSRQA
jgi:hypothetical protein